jgi:hypothetical protein
MTDTAIGRPAVHEVITPPPLIPSPLDARVRQRGASLISRSSIIQVIMASRTRSIAVSGR